MEAGSNLPFVSCSFASQMSMNGRMVLTIMMRSVVIVKKITDWTTCTKIAELNNRWYSATYLNEWRNRLIIDGLKNWSKWEQTHQFLAEVEHIRSIDWSLWYAVRANFVRWPSPAASTESPAAASDRTPCQSSILETRQFLHSPKPKTTSWTLRTTQWDRNWYCRGFSIQTDTKNCMDVCRLRITQRGRLPMRLS